MKHCNSSEEESTGWFASLQGMPHLSASGCVFLLKRKNENGKMYILSNQPLEILENGLGFNLLFKTDI